MGPPTRASLYAFWISNKLKYEKLSEELEKFVEKNKPNLKKDETEGFINFEKFDDDRKYVYFELYYSFVQEKADPAGIGTYLVPG